jgi:hypothetical protein
MLNCSRKLLKLSECKPGMKVVLRRPDRNYIISASNPALGSQWECIGIIEEVDTYEVYVCWENGYSNSYKDLELALVSSKEEISSGSYISIW